MEFWNQGTEEENIELLGKIARLREHGVDVEGLIDRIYNEETAGDATESTLLA